MKKRFYCLYALVYVLLILTLLLLCEKYIFRMMGNDIASGIDRGVDILLMGIFLIAIPLSIAEKRLFGNGRAKELPRYTEILRIVTLILAVVTFILILFSISVQI